MTGVNRRGAGRKKSKTKEEIAEILKEYNKAELTVKELSEKYGVSQATIFRYVKDAEEKKDS